MSQSKVRLQDNADAHREQNEITISRNKQVFSDINWSDIKEKCLKLNTPTNTQRHREIQIEFLSEQNR